MVKFVIALILIMPLSLCQMNIHKKENFFTVENLNLIKEFILEKGDRQTYCNMFNNNPHYSFDGVDAYLNPSPSGPENHPQYNIDCDPAPSDFNILVLKTADFQYYLIYSPSDTDSLKIITPWRRLSFKSKKQARNHFHRIIMYIKNMDRGNE